MHIIVSQHAKKRLQDLRQNNVSSEDIIKAASLIPGYVSSATRFRGFVSSDGRSFDIVAKDVLKGRLIITIIGK